MSEPVRIGILGCGRIVQKALMAVHRQVPEAELHAIASERPGVAAGVAKEHGVPRAYTSYEELLADPQIEAVYIPCSGDLHYRWTIEAARAGKHVLCEKPLATTVAEAEEMADVCRKQGVILQEAFMWRLTERAARTKQLIDQGEIGELRLINVSFSFTIDRNDWRMKPERGGGAMWDIGCYGVNAARFFTGDEPTTCEANAHWAETGVDLSMRIGLTFPGDVLANIDCSFETPWRCRAELVGSTGYIVLENAFQAFENSVIQIKRGVMRSDAVESIAVPNFNHHEDQLRHFCTSVRAGTLLAPAENGLANMQALQCILDSAQEHG